MLPHVFLYREYTVQDITRNNRLFGGIPVILGGNWAQILPVVPGGSQGAIFNTCLQQSYI